MLTVLRCRVGVLSRRASIGCRTQPQVALPRAGRQITPNSSRSPGSSAANGSDGGNTISSSSSSAWGHTHISASSRRHQPGCGGVAPGSKARTRGAVTAAATPTASTPAPASRPAADSRSAMAQQGDAAVDLATVAPAELWRLVVATYDRAQATGACSKTETQVEVLHDTKLGIEFVLRVASALKAKPQGPPAAPAAGPAAPAPGPAPASPSAATSAGQGQPSSATPPPAPAPAPWRNPFLPPDPELTVGPVGQDHVLVLNKFNVVAHHVLVITKRFRSQAEPLYGADLAATLVLLKAMPRGGVAFYNCGPQSGRSQPHKHLQVVPLPFTDYEVITAGSDDQAPVGHLVEAAAAAAGVAPLQAFEMRSLPYKCFAAMLPDSPTPEQLEAAFTSLLHRAFPGYTYTPAVHLPDGEQPRDAATAAAVAAGSVSYNVLMTTRWLVLVPRRQERCGPLPLNSLAFGGTLLVRSEEDLAYVREVGPGEILARIGEPWE